MERFGFIRQHHGSPISGGSSSVESEVKIEPPALFRRDISKVVAESLTNPLLAPTTSTSETLAQQLARPPATLTVGLNGLVTTGLGYEETMLSSKNFI